MQLHMHAQALMQVTLCVQFIACAKAKYFHFLFWYYYIFSVISTDKFFIERFFIEDYIQEI